MYQKIKYIIIVTFVFLISAVVLTLDANTRYHSVTKKKQNKEVEAIRQLNRQYYAQMQQQQALQKQNGTAQLPNGQKTPYYNPLQKKSVSAYNAEDDEDDEDEEYIEEETQTNTQKPSRPDPSRLYVKSYDYSLIDKMSPEVQAEARKSLEEQQARMQNNKEKEEPTGSKLTIEEDTDSNYEVQKISGLESYPYLKTISFAIDGQMFSIFFIEMSNNYSGSRKYYLYKKKDNTYVNPYYLFDATEVNGTTKTPEITLELKDNFLYMHYTGSTTINRSIGLNQLMY